MMTKMKKMNVLIYQVTRFARDKKHCTTKSSKDILLSLQDNKIHSVIYVTKII